MTARNAVRQVRSRIRGFGPVVGMPPLDPEPVEQLPDGWTPPSSLDRAPLDYALDDEEPLPIAARPMFGLCEKVLIGSIIAMGALALWIGFGG